MRPIHLFVSGLHSFREKQEVDFQALCEGGVFGIFGPTGSGKSSLLDAVTLALYGKVERATNNIQGIMNHAEKQLDVAFEFEIGEHVAGRRYRVERSYRRTKDDTVRTSSCRFMEIDQEERVVLADKERDVTATVETVLGLTLTDFTRAVVLPQGKFAEFLSLKGSERRQMLQRLFHLEQYGDRLNSRLKLRVDETKTILKEILAEQQGLGNASKEMLEEAEKQLEKAMEAVKQKDEALTVATQKFEEYRQIWSWQEELLNVEQRLKECEEKLPQIKELRNRLKKAREADSLFVYVEELDTAKIDKEQWSDRKASLEKDLVRTIDNVQQAKDVHHRCKDKRSSEEPMLYKRIQDYEHAMGLEVERKEKRELYQSEKEKLSQDEQKLNQSKAELDSLREKKQRAVDKQAEIDKELTEKTIGYEDRNRLREALSLKKDMLLFKEAMDSLLKERKENEESEKRIHSKQLELQTKRDQNVHRVHHILGQTEEIYNRICEHERVIEKSKNSIGQSIMEIASKQKEAEIHELAVQIASQLKDEQPCPVCGSIEHPNLVSSGQEKNDFIRQQTKLEEMLTTIRDEEVAITNNKRDLQHMFSTLKEFEDSREKNEEETAATIFDPINGTVESTGEVLDYLHLLQTETKGFRQDVLELIEKRDELLTRITAIEKERIEIGSKLETVKEHRSKITKKIAESEQKLRDSQGKWTDFQDHFPFDQLEKKQEEMDQRDKEAADLKQRYDKSVHFIEQIDGTIMKMSDQVQSIQLQVTKHSSAVEELQVRGKEISEKINEICGERSADELLRKAQADLTKLKRDEEEASRRLEEGREKLQQLEKEYETAKHSLSQAEKRVHTAEGKWTEKRKASVFKEAAEVIAAIIPSGTQQQWENEIETFSAAYQNIQHEKKKLDALLQTKTIEKDEWENAKVRLEKAKTEKEEALSLKAGLEVTVKDLKERAEKFEKLEQRRLETEALSERLGKLQAVFRGNGFVEFIAEEQLIQVAHDASVRLGELTKHRYALEVDSSGGFIIRDDANGGIRRPVSSLSGGETFLTSLALALSLSAQIQLQGQHPLEFFFLDEGFGTLDPELLDTVVTALERLQLQQLSVGVISHVPELRARLPKKLIVTPAQPSGRGSTLSIETI